MDSLCVPVQPEFKTFRSLAISRMREIYQDAAQVLVLDQDILHCSRDTPPIEKDSRISLSRWVRRLWTLQEGVLAKRLLFQFADGASDLEELYSLSTLPEHELHHNVENPTAEGVFNTLMILNKKSTGTLQITYAEKLKLILTAVTDRKTSKQEDEPVCLATLMALDSAPLLDTPKSARMAQLLRMLGDVFASTIFNEGPRLHLTGYGWAPQSFMEKMGVDVFHGAGFDLKNDPYNDTLVPVGSDGFITIKFPGLILPGSKTIFTPAWLQRNDHYRRYRQVTVSRGKCNNVDTFEESTLYFLRVIDDDDDTRRLCLRSGENFAIIFSQPATEQAMEIVGLMVAIGENDQEIKNARFLCRLAVTLIQKDPIDEYRSRGSAFLRKNRAWGEAVGSEQRWCFSPASENSGLERETVTSQLIAMLSRWT